MKFRSCLFGLFLVLPAIICLPFNVQAENTYLTIGTGGTGGGYYPLGGGIASVLSEKIPNVVSTAQVTGGTMDNYKLIEKGKCQLGLVTGASQFVYVKEKVARRDYPFIAGIAAAGSADITLVTLAKSSINSWSDLKGKRVAMGSPGSSTAVIVALVLPFFDLTIDDLKPAFISFSEATSALKDGRIDASVYFITGRPGSAILDLATSRDIKIISMEKDKIEAINNKYPHMISTVVPKGLYRGVDYEYSTIMFYDYFVGHKDLPVELVYEITKQLDEALPDLKKNSYHGFKAFEMSTKASSSMFPLHPGAAKYYKEKGY